MPITRWLFKIVPCLAEGNASATFLKMLVMRFADVQWPAPLSFHSISKAHYKCQVIIIIIIINNIIITIIIIKGPLLVKYSWIGLKQMNFQLCRFRQCLPLSGDR